MTEWAYQRFKPSHSFARRLAHCILLRHGWIHTEADAWLLTGELALPTCEARRVRTIKEAFQEQQWATHWLLLFQIASVRLQRKAA